MSPPSDPIEALIRVSKQLGDLRDRCAFLGGASAPLFVTDSGTPSPRPTKDVDAVVQCQTYGEYGHLGDELRKRDFEVDTDEGAPICRWILKGTPIKLDLMPTDPRVLGLDGQWFDVAFRESTVLRARGEDLRVVSAPCFLATKLEAFHDRGKGDYLGSHDLEDIIAVVDGRLELLVEVQSAPAAVQSYLREELRKLLTTEAFLDALPGHLAGDAESQGRVRELTRRLKVIAGLEAFH